MEAPKEIDLVLIMYILSGIPVNLTERKRQRQHQGKAE